MGQARHAQGTPPIFESTWSDELVQRTREFLDSGGLMLSHNGKYHFKNSDRRFGAIDEADLIAGRYRLREPNSGEQQDFPDADALIAAGWAID